MSEQRLIDANAFKRYLDDGDECINCPKKGMFCGHHCELDNVESNQFARIIDEQPTVDAVQIVRCKDCLHHTDVEPYDHECELIPSNAVFCQHFAVVRDKDWFCADGERGSDDKS